MRHEILPLLSHRTMHFISPPSHPRQALPSRRLGGERRAVLLFKVIRSPLYIGKSEVKKWDIAVGNQNIGKV